MIPNSVQYAHFGVVHIYDAGCHDCVAEQTNWKIQHIPHCLEKKGNFPACQKLCAHDFSS